MKKLADLLKALEGISNVADLTEVKTAVQTFMNDLKEYDSGLTEEVKTKNIEIRGLNDKIKGFETGKGETEKITGNYTKILKTLNLDDTTDDLDSALTELTEKLQAGELAGKSKGELEKQISELTKNHNATAKELAKVSNEKTLLETTVTQERAKRQNAIKDRVIMSALADNKVIKPKEISKILTNSVKVNDDDTVSYINAKGEEVAFDVGIKSWLDDNPEFISNDQTPGSGSGGAGGAGSKGRLTVTAAQFKDPAWYESNREAVMDDRVDIVG